MRFRIEEEITQQKGGAGPGRREEEEKVVQDGWWWQPKPPLPTKECRCPSCNYVGFIEEGARCLLQDCPACGCRLEEI